MLTWILNNPKKAIALELAEAALLILIGYYAGSSRSDYEEYRNAYIDAQAACQAGQD